METKYRRWNLETSTMEYGSIKDSEWEFFKHEMDPDKPLMFSIGVKDILEKEVFEGDIRRFKGWLGIVALRGDKPVIEIPGTQKVEFHPKEFFADSIYIGNIYEG